LFFELGFQPPIGQVEGYHIARQTACKSDNIRCAEFILCLMTFMPPSQAACEQRLSRLWLLPIIKRKKKTAPETLAPRAQAGPVPINIGERRGGE